MTKYTVSTIIRSMRYLYFITAITLLVTAATVYRLNSKPALDESARKQLGDSFIALDDGITHYELTGPADGPLVVLVHGFSTPNFIWDSTVPALVDAGFRVLRYDLYGRGLSDRPRVDYTMDLYDRQLQQLLAALGLSGPVNLVGHSMGGGIVVLYAAKHPEQVHSLALMAPLNYPAPLSWDQQLIRVPLLGEFLAAWFGPSMIRELTRDSLYNFDSYPGFMDQFDRQLDFRGVEQALVSSLRNLDYDAVIDAYGVIGQSQLPILLVWGRDDRVLPFSASRRVLELIPNARFVPLDQTGHCPHYEQPQNVNPALVEFLSERGN